MTTGLTFYEKAHRYRLDGQWVPSVTTISKTGGGCEGLIKWSGEVSAGYAYDHNGLAVDLSREAFVTLVSTEARRQRDEASAAGVEVHRLAQLLLADEDVAVPDYLVPHVEGAVRLIEQFDMHALLTECNVGNRAYQYAGRFDLVARLVTARLGEHVALIDWKTGKSVWTDVALQLAGYARAEFADVDGEEMRMPEVDAYYVAHVTADSAELVPVLVDSASWDSFLAARRLLMHTRLRRDDVIGMPEDALENTGDKTA